MTDMWVVPPAAKSSWFAKIDWYLNWQMSKGLAHETRRPPVELLRLSEENHLPWIPPPETQATPLLIASRGRLPVTRCLVLDGETLKPWLTRLSEIATSLNVSSVRVFLPRDFKLEKVESTWDSLKVSNINIEFSTDEEAKEWLTQAPTN